MPYDLRSALREVGLSQSGFARTLVAWGDPRPFDVVLRWVQRAVAGAEVGPHVEMVLRMLQWHLQQRQDKRRTLMLLESGNMKSRRNIGAGWEDTTANDIVELKRQIGELDRLLAESRLTPDSTPILSLQDINAETLERFQRLYVVPEDDDESAYLVWDSHRLLPLVSWDHPGTLVEDGMVSIASLKTENLKEVLARITEAGGQRGLVEIARVD